MRPILRYSFIVLFTVFLIGFLLIALVMVAAQVAGLVMVQPELVQGASDTLLRPSIIAAILVGLSGFATFTVTGEEDGVRGDD